MRPAAAECSRCRQLCFQAIKRQRGEREQHPLLLWGQEGGPQGPAAALKTLSLVPGQAWQAGDRVCLAPLLGDHQA